MMNLKTTLRKHMIQRPERMESYQQKRMRRSFKITPKLGLIYESHKDQMVQAIFLRNLLADP